MDLWFNHIYSSYHNGSEIPAIFLPWRVNITLSKKAASAAFLLPSLYEYALQKKPAVIDSYRNFITGHSLDRSESRRALAFYVE